MIKKIFGTIWREADNTTFQQRAMQKAEKIAHGEKVLAPKHPTDERVTKEALRNKQIREELDTKHESLVNQVNRINIVASPPESEHVKPRPDKDSLRTPKNNEHDLHRYEYGIYELPTHQLTKNHLSFREALEILRARMETDPESDYKSDPEAASSSANFLLNHPAVKRVEADRLDTLYRYFRPFIRKDKQRVVVRAYVEGVRDVAEGKYDRLNFAGTPSQIINDLLVAKKLKNKSIEEERFQFMEDEKQTRIAEGIRARRKEESQRLEKQMEEFQKLQEESRRSKVTSSEALETETANDEVAKKDKLR